MRVSRAVSRFASALVLAACTGLCSAAPSFADWSETFAAHWVRLSAEHATSSQYFSGEEQAAFDRQLTPNTPEQRERRQALARDGLAQLDGFDVATLTPDQQVGAATLRWSLRRTLAGQPFQDHSFIFNPLSGPHIRYVSLLAENQALRRVSDVPAFLSRLAQVDLRLDEAIARARPTNACWR